jgi:Fe-S cluster assembly protein SufD
MSSRKVVRGDVRSAGSPPGEWIAYDEGRLRATSHELDEPAWLLDRRLAAWHTYQRLPMPATSEEAWRRTDLRGLAGQRVVPGAASDAAVPDDLLQPLAAEAHGALIVQRPGHPPESSGGDGLAAQGVIFAPWRQAADAHPDLLRRAVGQVVADDEGKFAALAAASVTDGILLFVPAGTQVTAPLHSVLWAPGAGRLFASRVIVVVEEGGSATFVHESASPTSPGEPSVHAGIVEVHVGPGAHLTFVELQNWGEHVWNFTHERARVAKDGALDWIFGAVGSRLTKNFSDLELAGQGAQGRMSGFYFTDGSQHLDHDTQQNHLAANTTSDLLYKGALHGRSRSVWQGMIYVAPGAQQTDGYQANRNLILSQEARADSIPGLEILADDVRCSHGATVGQLEEEPVFYLMSRGIPRREAERLVVDGFFDPILQRIPFEGVRARFKQMIVGKMG